ncbi:glutathione S-transferase Mu 1-like isoform X2 [Castor canadensis]|uniref:Glutathione S-transferase Mu 1-like isoform X2 n=1 Tax=Castor canadensis TaxID=51338 RepID=A0AC58KPT3_CASCN
MPMTLGYWGFRGMTHPIRLLLEYTDSSYEEKRYTIGDAPDYDRSQWLSEKFTLGLDFPNLPYLIDGARKITQSNAILHYIARKHDLCGETEEEKIRVDIVENQVMDTRMQFFMLCFNPDFEKQKLEYLQDLPEKMKLYSQSGEEAMVCRGQESQNDLCLHEVQPLPPNICIFEDGPMVQ